MIEKLKNINGCLGDGHTDDDWKLTWEMVDNLPELETQDQIIFEYNQSGTPHCTIYSALWALSDLFNREVTQEQIDEVVEESYNRGRVRWEGRYVQSAVDLACDKRMEWYPNEKVAYYRVSNYDDEEIAKIIEKNYTLCTWFNGNRKYQLDRYDNGRIDGDDFGKSTYGHAVSLIGREGKKFVKDNYKGRRENWYYTNIYEIIPPISRLRINNCWQFFSYLIVKVKDEREKDIERLNKMKNSIDKMIEYTEECIKMNSAMWENTNDKTYREKLHTTNDQLRLILISHKQKKKDIEIELWKYFK